MSAAPPDGGAALRFSVSMQVYISLSFFFVLRFAIERATGSFFTFVAQLGISFGGDEELLTFVNSDFIGVRRLCHFGLLREHCGS